MTLDKILIGLLSLAGMAFTYWFFLMKKEEVVSVTDSVDITVEGGYQPEVISIAKGKTTKINFLRTDPTDCLSEVVLADFKIRKDWGIQVYLWYEYVSWKNCCQIKNE